MYVYPVSRNSDIFAYKYTSQSNKLASFHPINTYKLSDHCREIVTPLKWAAWQEALSRHPDNRFAEYLILVHGIKHGFRIGYNHASHSKRSRPATCSDNPGPVQDYLDKEIAARRVVEVKGPDVLRSHKQVWGYS